ncbi:MAG: ASCH domain-containing protein [Desulfurococcaceae archaeon]
MTRVKYLGRHIMIKGKYVEDIILGRKKSTIRRGIVKPKYREVILHGGGRPVAKVLIEKVFHKKVCELTDSDALNDGFKSREELIRELKETYPGITNDDWITIIEFKLIQRIDEINRDDKYLGLKPVDIARIALRYLSNELSDEDRKILIELTRSESIRATAYKLFKNIDKRYIVRKVLMKALDKLVSKGILRKSVRNDLLDSQMQ